MNTIKNNIPIILMLLLKSQLAYFCLSTPRPSQPLW